jgi:hypothetical protein
MAQHDNAPHAPLEPAPARDGRWQTPCRCGWTEGEGFTPSHSYQVTRLHASKQNKKEMGA